MRNNGILWVKAAAGVIIAAAAGFGGYNLITTGCVLGSCSTDGAESNVVAVADTSGDYECSSKTDCPMTGASVETVALEGGECSSSKSACDSEAKSDCSGETMAVASTSDASDCSTKSDCSGEEGAVAVQSVALNGEAEGCATKCETECSDEQKAECAESKACSDEQKAECSGEAQAKTCPITGEVIEVAGGD